VTIDLQEMKTADKEEAEKVQHEVAAKKAVSD